MQKFATRLLLAAAVGLTVAVAHAKPNAPAEPPAKTETPTIKLIAPDLPAPSYVLIDYQTGKILAQKNPDQRREPASLTKMMTAYVVFAELKSGRLKSTDLVTISKKAWRARGTRTFLQVGSQVPVDVLLKGLMIQSGNDAAIALAEHVGGSVEGFATLMNHHAKELGMTNSHFVNPHGLPNREHYSTARDLAKLALAQVRNFPEHRSLYSTKEFTWNNIRQYNRNKLLWRDPSVDGIKTGYTERAKYCQAASAERDGVRMISVLLGAQSPGARTRQLQKLLDYGFAVHQHRQTNEAQHPRAEPRV